jgi:Na+-transporting methylmalonyl-CoA/oxaloacetate decarboxylase gamma subunit
LIIFLFILFLLVPFCTKVASRFSPIFAAEAAAASAAATDDADDAEVDAEEEEDDEGEEDEEEEEEEEKDDVVLPSTPYGLARKGIKLSFVSDLVFCRGVRCVFVMVRAQRLCHWCKGRDQHERNSRDSSHPLS